MSKHRQSAIMQHFSTLAGPLQSVREAGSQQVQFRNISSYDTLPYRIWTRFVAAASLLLVVAFASVLFYPGHWIIVQQPESPLYMVNALMLTCLILLQVFGIVGTLSAARATVKAKDPVPLQPPKGLKVAFATTRAPGEPVEMVRKTLEAARRVHYRRGSVDVWLLDETKDPALVALCEELGVHYFSRSGIERWNTPKPSRQIFKKLFVWHEGKVPVDLKTQKPNPTYAARSKHGNFNAWGDFLTEQKLRYDIIAGVDTDQVPEPNYLERLLGYFHDPDVAYVVGPQVYGNYRSGLRGLVARWAESQASFFQSTIQRAGNDSNSPMFVGTNYAVRTYPLHQIRGFQPCITEDMATGLAIHAHRNPTTGQRWKSVYTPDVLAVGEGPDMWGSFFTQQWRWAAGTFDTWLHVAWRIPLRISFHSLIHYFLMLTHYPLIALTWLLAVTSSILYLVTGATAVLAPWSQFASLYLMTLVMQWGLYFWNRRFNVSPHEPSGSYGVAGMVMSTLTAPVYFSALIGILSGKKPHFVVTKKGAGGGVDHLSAFRTHLQWGVLLTLCLVYGVLHGNAHPAMLLWVGGLLAVCLTPPILAAALAAKKLSIRHPFTPREVQNA